MTDISKIRIALDGPSGAGKSTIAKKVAAKLGIVYVDTGALYRTVGFYMASHGIGKDDTSAIIKALADVSVNLAYENGAQKVFLNGEDVGDKIRTPEATAYASAVSKIPEVRAFLLDVQRSLANRGGVIMDGRDIGTVIMPDAELKVFMTATTEARAKRRYLEFVEKGIECDYETVLSDIIARDKQDSERDVAPCVPAEDAELFVNDDYGIEESADYIIGLIK